MALVKCGECGREVSDKAAACPQCGAPVAAPAVAAPSAPLPTAVVSAPAAVTKQKSNPVGKVLLSLGLLGGLWWSCGVLCRGSSPGAASASASAESTPPAPTITVDAVKLWQDYEANEVAADNVYKGQVLEVTGAVTSIDKDFMDNIVLHLRTPNQFEHVMATMRESQGSRAANLSKGEKVVVVCKGGGRIVGSPALRECVFAQ